MLEKEKNPTSSVNLQDNKIQKCQMISKHGSKYLGLVEPIQERRTQSMTGT